MQTNVYVIILIDTLKNVFKRKKIVEKNLLSFFFWVLTLNVLPIIINV